MSDDSGLIDHFERHLGTIQGGWKDPNTEIQVIAFPNQPFPGVQTLSTLGLSHHSLTLPEGRAVRQELLVIVDNQRPQDEWISVLFNYSEHLLSQHRAILDGEILHFSSPIFENSNISSFAACGPVYMKDSFHVYRDLEPPVVLVWLIPLFPAEVAFVNEHGWRALEEAFVEKNPQLWNIRRPMVKTT